MAFIPSPLACRLLGTDRASARKRSKAIVIFRKLALSLSLLVVATGAAARADVQKGMHIYSACRGVNVHFCQGYIAAIADEMDRGIEFRRHRACIPENITILQLRLVVSKWMSEHQQYRHDPAAGLVAEALAAAFPCSVR